MPSLRPFLDRSRGGRAIVSWTGSSVTRSRQVQIGSHSRSFYRCLPRRGRYASLREHATRFAAGLGAEFGEDGADVVADGLDRDDQLLRDLGVGQAVADQLEHFHLAVGQAGGIGPGAPAKNVRGWADAAALHEPAGAGGGGLPATRTWQGSAVGPRH